jgi:ribonucrease Y
LDILDLAQVLVAAGEGESGVSLIAFGVGILVAFLVGLVGTQVVLRKLAQDPILKAEEQARSLLNRAQTEAEQTIKSAQEESRQVVALAKQEFEKEARRRREEMAKQEKRLLDRERALEKKSSTLDRQEGDIKKLERTIEKREEDIVSLERQRQALIDDAQKKLEEIAGLTREQAKQSLVSSVEEEARKEASLIVLRVEEETRREADAKANEILATAIQRYAGEQVAERTMTVLTLPNDEMKGRIIGREGRNIRAIEAATGVDVIIDDTPETIILSGFNPLRREVARLSIDKLLQDGRIHPGRIEEIVAKTRREVDALVQQAGEQAAFDLQIHGLHPELVKLVGRQKYFYTAAHSLYQHSIEVANLAGAVAGELKANVKLARRAGLLHDIGKVADHDIEGSHAVVGAELAKRFGESADVIHAIRAHHEEEPLRSLVAHAVFVANRIARQRPGARHEMLDQFVQRVAEIEELCRSFKGVSDAFALNAGKDIRVLVENASVSDSEAVILARDIARRIQTDLVYPGQIKVSVTRETRAMDIAK